MQLIETLRYYFLPLSSNNHRARALHPSALLLYIIFFVILASVLDAVHIVRPDILGYATNINVEELLQKTNQKRTEQGIAPLKLNEKLSESARKKAIDMFNQNYWAHTSPNGTTPWTFILDSGYSYRVAGENLAKNFDNSAAVVEAWMNSPSHKENILKSEYEEIGFAVVDGKLQGEETTLVVQMFGAPQSSQLAQARAESESVPEEEVILPTPTAIRVPEATGLAARGLNQARPEAAAPIIRNRAAQQQPSLSTLEIAGIKSRPLIDLRVLKRALIIAVLLFLSVVTVIDGYFVYAHKKVRIAGRNWAHLIFLISILGIVIFSGAGAII